MPKFELKTDGRRFYWSLQTDSGDAILVASEAYPTRTAAELAIAAVRRNSILPGRYLRRRDVAGLMYFQLLAANGDVLGKSQSYSKPEAMERGIESVKSAAWAARIHVKEAFSDRPAAKA